MVILVETYYVGFNYVAYQGYGGYKYPILPCWDVSIVIDEGYILDI